MKYLLDSNIVLEYLLDQNKADECEQLMRTVPISELAVSTFSLHSIGVILTRKRFVPTFQAWIHEFVGAGVPILALSGLELILVSKITERMGLDFDDAYQYVVAEKYDLAIVSFDSDFNRTSRGRTTPAAIISRLKLE